MIQRIQSVFLLVVVFLQSVLFFSTQVTAIIDGTTSEGTFSVSQTWEWALLAALTAIIPLVTIFLYKKRRLQVRLSIINALLLLALQIVIVVYVVKINNLYEHVSYSFTVVSPIISLILTILAIRYIIKDELLIKSLNRLR